jgi:5,10-methylene-tetrahydrofolate dehydrogenase/Methenyl tetrahydrofolate cyclohydrolase
MTVNPPTVARILDGKRIAEQLLDELKTRVDARLAQGLPRPGLAVILVGGDPASSVYVRNKRRCRREGRDRSRMITTCPKAPARPSWPH